VQITLTNINFKISVAVFHFRWTRTQTVSLYKGTTFIKTLHKTDRMQITASHQYIISHCSDGH